MAVLQIDNLDPDGAQIVVLWDTMRVGDSVFIPCVNTTAAVKQVRGVFERRQWEFESRVRIENNIWGIRIWRSA